MASSHQHQHHRNQQLNHQIPSVLPPGGNGGNGPNGGNNTQNNGASASKSLANMLRPKTLNSILAKANTGGVKCTLLLNREGSLLAYAGGTDEEAITTAALASTIWKNFEKYGNSAFHEDKIKCALIQCQDANLVVRNLSTVLLCIYSNQDVPLGMLKNKARSLAEYIEEPLDKILRP